MMKLKKKTYNYISGFRLMACSKLSGSMNIFN